MGIVCGLDRDRHSYTARVVQCLATTHYCHSKMIPQSPVLPLLVITVLSSCRALDLGHGGVYDSPAAAQYWEERFGDLFAGGQGALWGIQENIDVDPSLTKEQPTSEPSQETSLPSASTSSSHLLPTASKLPSPSTPPSPSSPSPYPTRHISVIYFPMAAHPTFISPIVSNILY